MVVSIHLINGDKLMPTELTLEELELLYRTVTTSVIDSSLGGSEYAGCEDVMISEHLLAAKLLKLIFHKRLTNAN